MKNIHPMRHTFTKIAFSFLAVLSGITGYYFFDLLAAKKATTALVAEAPKRFGGPQLTLGDLPEHRKTMLLLVEDPAFMRHHGVDLYTPGAGMTTITQGLVKLLYFPDGFKAGIAKVRQTLIAQYALDALVSKPDQLQLFLNISYLGTHDGRSVHGYSAAAQAYFNKPFVALSDDEFLSLVAMHIGPNQLKPGTPENASRVQRIRAYLRHELRPASLLDVDYDGKQGGSVAEEALMWLLRRLTDARPID